MASAGGTFRARDLAEVQEGEANPEIRQGFTVSIREGGNSSSGQVAGVGCGQLCLCLEGPQVVLLGFKATFNPPKNGLEELGMALGFAKLGGIQEQASCYVNKLVQKTGPLS